MTGARSLVALLSAIATGSVAIGVVRWRRAFGDVVVAGAQVSSVTSSARIDSGAIDSSIAMLVDNDPFRFSNTPPSVRFDPAADGLPAVAEAPAVRPQLVLKAIVGGPPWSAVIDGLPGQPPGAVVRPGSRFDQITVSAVTRDSVVVRASDTTWVLRFGGRS
ncbi:MAG TPA: hypothetical protein VHB25_19245 [Gemmatimonadaceae bacterium]|nr:hypothetical protein [Gemmatimonadaceae bacterium]